MPGPRLSATAAHGSRNADCSRDCPATAAGPSDRRSGSMSVHSVTLPRRSTAMGTRTGMDHVRRMWTAREIAQGRPPRIGALKVVRGLA